MGFRVGFHKTLLRMGTFRFGIGYSTRGVTGIAMLLTFGFFNLMWKMIVLIGWLCYYLICGVIWIYYKFFALLIKAIKRLFKIKQDPDNTDSSI